MHLHWSRIFGLLLVLLPAVEAAAQATETGKAEYLFSVFFGGGSYVVTDDQLAELRAFMEHIPRIEEYEVELHGHTDNIGSREYNLWLSEQRTRAIFERLVLENIPDTAIEILDFGEQAPVYDNSTWEGKLRNRRVDIIFKRIVM